MSIDPTQFHQVFFEESLEGLEAMEGHLVELTPGEVDAETVNAIFRVAHTIKGGSATFGFGAIAAFSHEMENLLDRVRDGELPLDTPRVDLLLECVDLVRGMVAEARDGEAQDQARIAATIKRIGALAQAPTAPPAPTAKQHPEEPTAPRPESFAAPTRDGMGWRIRFRPEPGILAQGNDVVLMFRALAELGDLEVRADCSALPLLEELDTDQCHLSWELDLHGAATEAELREVFEWVEDECELSIEPLATPAPTPVEPSAPAPTPAAAAPPPGDGIPTGASRAGSSIRVATHKVDQLLDLVGELVITQSMLGELAGTLEEASAERLRVGLDQLERQARELQEGVMQIRMLPISFVFNRFPRMVHDLSTELGKQVALEIRGETTEVDKTVMEAIGDPLVHLVRNAIDHGLESPDARRARGKTEQGLIRLAAYHRGGSIYVEVEDDGAGLDETRILTKARELGMIDTGEQLAAEQVQELIFRPGFSTARAVSGLSGRGVGLDVVARNIRKLGGSVRISSRLGHGTCFTIRLPLTLAIMDGQLMRSAGGVYVVPLESMVETLPLDQALLGRVAGEGEVYRLRDGYIPVHRLDRLFGAADQSCASARPLLMVLEAGGHRMGLVVDALLHQQQVVIKSLEANFWKVDGIAAATILGDGSVGLILDVSGLLSLVRGAQAPDGLAGWGPRLQ